MSRINSQAFQVFILICVGFSVSCKTEEETASEKKYQIQQSYQRLKEPPFKKEIFVQKTQAVKIVETLKSVDKYKRNRVQIYIRHRSGLNTTTLLSLLQTRTEDVFWIYVSPKNPLDKKELSHQILCQKPYNSASPVLPLFKKKHVYNAPKINCIFDYQP